MAVDQLVSVRLILPNKTVATISAQSPDAELWWALRGGGGGNFGVATQFTTSIFYPEPRSTIGEICWPEFSEQVRPLMSEWIEKWPSMPKWLLLDPCWLPIGPNKTRMFCFTVVCNNLPQLCDPWVAPLFAAAPHLNTLEVQPFVRWARANVNVTSAQEGFLYLKSFVFHPANFSIHTIDVLVDALKHSPSGRNLVLFHVGGGAINEVPGNATAFPHRDSIVLLQIKTIWNHPDQQSENRAWISGVSQRIASNVSGAYVNYIDADLKEWPTAYYGAQGYSKLRLIKSRVDPGNFFHFNQSIGSEYPG